MASTYHVGVEKEIASTGQTSFEFASSSPINESANMLSPTRP